MTKKEILEFNKKCAKFLNSDVNKGLKRIYIKDMEDKNMIFHNHSVDYDTYEWNGTENIYYIPFDILEFHSNWNWIKEVLDKIASLNEDNFSTKTQHAFENLLDLSVFSSMSTFCIEINQFLIWYEQNK